MEEICQYHCAIYLRLSRDDVESDGVKKKESNSIYSQRMLIQSYLKTKDEINCYDIYIDDGFSGANFERPDFKRMMKDIEAGHVNCVIVKDLSRLGRDYIEAGRLIQKTFPAFCVRFISVTDPYDSLTANYSDTSLVIPVKNFVNDSYCRDISQKVKSHQKVKRENGEFIGSFAVYGYKKDPQNRNKLLPDCYAAKVVKDIFAWKIAGMSNQSIANKLNDTGILSPLEYKKVNGEKYATSFGKGSIVAKWSAVAIKRILVNEMYLGTLVQGKEEKINYKMKKSFQKPEHEWVRVDNTHAPIIKKEDFNLVRRLLSLDTRAVKGSQKAHMFSGLLYCGDCGKKMIRRKFFRATLPGEQIYFICQTKNKGHGCSRHSIAEESLIHIVSSSLNKNFAQSVKEKQTCACNNKYIECESKAEYVQQQQLLMVKQQRNYDALCKRLDEDLKTGLLNEVEYHSCHKIFEQKYYEMRNMFQMQEQYHQNTIRRHEERNKAQHFCEKMTMKELDRTALMTFIERITIFENCEVELCFCFQKPACREVYIK
jgi:DNA invertase Pin-like site-specific DNA recombinase